MKRSAPLRRVTGLSRSTALRPRSRKMAAAYMDRRAFVAETLADRPRCEIRWDERCRGRSEGVHEITVKRSHGGAIVPGPKAEAQGQRWAAACHPCNGAIEDAPAEARRRGWA